MTWASTRLDAICSIQTGPFGSQLHQEDYVEVGTPIITVEHLGGYRIKRENLPMVSEDDAERLRKYSLLPGDVVFSRVGSVDQSSFVTGGEEGWLFSGRCLRVRPHLDKVDPIFVYYALNTSEVKSFIMAIAVGATMPSINTAILSEVQIPSPPIEQQSRISSILRSLDDKIAANQTAIRNGDALMLAHYKATPKCPAEPFEQVCDVFGGSTPSTKRKEFWGGGIQWATPTDLTGLNGPWLTSTERTVTNAGLQSMSSALHPEGSILMTSRATIGSVALAAEPVATNQGFIVVRASEELTPWIFCQLQDRVREFEAWSNGATFLELSRGNFKKLPFHRTGPEALESFNQKAWPILQMCKSKQAENVSLAKIRDELLPLLMSGKITVKEAEQEATSAGADIAGEENEA